MDREEDQGEQPDHDPEVATHPTAAGALGHALLDAIQLPLQISNLLLEGIALRFRAHGVVSASSETRPEITACLRPTR